VEDRGRREADPDQRRACLNERLYQAFIEGLEEDSSRRLECGLTAEEMEPVIWHYPGDVTDDGGFSAEDS
jgi:hypothetical protein